MGYFLKVGGQFLAYDDGGTRRYLVIGPTPLNANGDPYNPALPNGGAAPRILIMMTQTRDIDEVSAGATPTITGDITWHLVDDSVVASLGDKLSVFWAMAPADITTDFVGTDDGLSMTATTNVVEVGATTVTLTCATDQAYIFATVYSVADIDQDDPIVQFAVGDGGSIPSTFTLTYASAFESVDNISFTGSVGQDSMAAADPATVAEHTVIDSGPDDNFNAIAFVKEGEPTDDEVVWTANGQIGNDNLTIAIELRRAA